MTHKVFYEPVLFGLTQTLKSLSTPTSTPADSAPQPIAETERLVLQTGNDKTKLKLYGQLNRGVLVVDDGDSANTYQVDNDHSSTRIGLKASVAATEGWSLGSRFEVEFESNSSSAVSQEEKNGVGGNNFHERWAEIFVNAPVGKLSLGQGDTAKKMEPLAVL
ncbi:MAG: porin [Desulfuromonadales bacterium]|nr:porin [Desulfuromonadales bacterium]